MIEPKTNRPIPQERLHHHVSFILLGTGTMCFPKMSAFELFSSEVGYMTHHQDNRSV